MLVFPLVLGWFHNGRITEKVICFYESQNSECLNGNLATISPPFLDSSEKTKTKSSPHCTTNSNTDSLLSHGAFCLPTWSLPLTCGWSCSFLPLSLAHLSQEDLPFQFLFHHGYPYHHVTFNWLCQGLRFIKRHWLAMWRKEVCFLPTGITDGELFSLFSKVKWLIWKEKI